MPIEEWSESILIAELVDEPTLSEEMDNLARRLEEGTPPLPDVVLNFQAVSYVNSSNIAQLLKVRKRLTDGGGRLRLCCIPDQIWSVLLATGLDGVFEFTEDIATSLASLQIGD